MTQTESLILEAFTEVSVGIRELRAGVSALEQELADLILRVSDLEKGSDDG